MNNIFKVVSPSTILSENSDNLKDIIFGILYGLIIIVILIIVIYNCKKYLVPLLYRFIYRNHLEMIEESYVVIDVRVYGKKDERLVIENEDMDRFIIFENKYSINVSGDVLEGYKEVNRKTDKINYFYNSVKVYSKKLDRGE